MPTPAPHRYHAAQTHVLDDLLGLIVRANRIQITPAIYRRKVSRWIRYWPDLTVLPWAAGRGDARERRSGAGDRTTPGGPPAVRRLNPRDLPN